MSEPESRVGEGAPRIGRGRARVIWNATAGQKRPFAAQLSGDELGALLSRHGLDFELVETTTTEQATEQAAAAVREKRALVVAAGGDGTVSGIAAQLIDSDTALGILPLGSVMNVARMLGLPLDLDEAAAVLAGGMIRQIDVGEANGQLFYEAASVGLNTTIFAAAEHFVEGEYGSLPRLLWLALRYRPARMRLLLDDETVSTRALMVAVANGPYTGAGMTIAPDARIDDGLLDVTVFRHFSKFELVRHLVSISFGRRRYTPHLRTYRSARVRVESRRPLPVRADGAELGTTPLECRIRPACLRVIVPRVDERVTAELARPSAAGG